MNGKLMLDFEERELHRNKIVKEIVIWVGSIGGSIFIAFLIMHFAFEKTTMLDTSMESTLKKNDKIVINKASYLLSSPDRFDVIVYEKAGREHSYYGIKRVIGIPGDEILIKDSHVYINGEELEEEYNVDPIENPGLAEEKFTLEDDEYFVLGDNRNNSEDSRYASVGNINKDEIIGKAFVKLGPLEIVSQLNRIEKPEETEKPNE